MFWKLQDVRTLKRWDPSSKYFATNDLIFRQIGTFFISIGILKIIHMPHFGLCILTRLIYYYKTIIEYVKLNQWYIGQFLMISYILKGFTYLNLMDKCKKAKIPKMWKAFKSLNCTNRDIIVFEVWRKCLSFNRIWYN